ncbi:MAG: hypothetical protein WDZ28_05075 [Simkaniaceae bacterium]
MKAILFGTLAAFSLSAKEPPKWIYEESVNGQQIQTLWYEEKKGDELLLEGQNSKSLITIRCSDEFVIDKIKYVNKKGEIPQEYTCQRKGSSLYVTSLFGDRKIEKNFKIGNSAWVQEFGFGLRPFVQSEYRSYKFSIINPKDFTLNALVAKKERIELITLNAQTYKAQKIKITLQGFKSMFWTAHAWFDTVSGNLLMYRGNKGPNTPTTIITLLEEKAL